MNARWTAPVALVALVLGSAVVRAEHDATQVTDAQLDALAAMDIEELLQAPTTVASGHATSLRESPGVITRITRDEILSSGARDLVDVLSLVPGFFTGVDVQGTLGVGVRGIWGHEGKVLFLVDGQPLTELSYSTTTLGGRVPVELIDHIEILRGPGSARYGGFAELAVVNIVLIEAGQEPGTRLYASGNASALSNTWGRQNGTAMLSHRFESIKDLTLTARGNLSQTHPSNARYRDFYGNSYSMTDKQRWSERFATLGAKYRALDVRYMYEDYGVRYADGYDDAGAVPGNPKMSFLSHHLSAQLPISPIASLTITPRFEYHRQLPFNTPIDDRKISQLSADQLAEAALFYYDRLAERTVSALRVDWDALPQLKATVGGQVNFDRARQNRYDPRVNTFAGESLYTPSHLTATFVNLIAFTELSTENKYVNVTAGARYEHHSRFGSAFAPRLALSKVMGDFHAKALVAEAFRSPGFENINLGQDVKPEHLRTFELETGYRITPELLATINAFDTSVRRVIVYSFDPTSDTEGYHNGSRTGSRGLESELRYATARGYLTTSYAYYSANGKNRVPDYAVPGHPASLLAAPNHKLSVHAHARVYKSLHADLTGFLLSVRYAQTGVDADSNAKYGQLAPACVVNLFVEYRDLWLDGLRLGLGAYNLTGQQFSYPQPYDGLHAALPGLPREYLARVSYER